MPTLIGSPSYLCVLTMRSPHSYQPVLCWAECLHLRGVGGSDAAADGAEPPPHAAHAHRHPVAYYVSPPGGLCHEHPVTPHRQAGRNPIIPPFGYYWLTKRLRTSGSWSSSHSCGWATRDILLNSVHEEFTVKKEWMERGWECCSVQQVCIHGHFSHLSVP